MIALQSGTSEEGGGNAPHDHECKPRTNERTNERTESPAREIIACLRDAADIASLGDYKSRVLVEADLDEALEAAAAFGAKLLIVDIGLFSHDALGSVARRIAHANLACPVLLRFTLSRVTAGDLWWYSRERMVDWRLSLRGGDNLVHPLRGVVPCSVVCATFELLNLLDALVPAGLRPQIAAFVTLSRRSVYLKDVADVLGESEATLRASLSSERAAHPRLPAHPRMNAELLAAHLLRTRSAHGLGREEAAHRAGFSSGKRCDDYLKRHHGMTAKQLLRAGKYESLLSVIRGWFGDPGSQA